MKYLPVYELRIKRSSVLNKTYDIT